MLRLEEVTWSRTGESVCAARAAGHDWSEIAAALGQSPDLRSWEEISGSLAASRQAVWGRTPSED